MVIVKEQIHEDTKGEKYASYILRAEFVMFFIVGSLYNPLGICGV